MQQATVVYAAFTLLLVLLILALLGALSRQPLLSALPGYERPAGWPSITAPDKSFTLDLPRDWGWVAGEELAAMPAAQRAELLDLGQPLLEDTATLALVAWSEGDIDGANARLVIARDAALAGMTPGEAVQRVEDAASDGLSGSGVENFARPRAEILLTRRSLAWGELRCRQLLVPIDGAGLVVAVCGAPPSFRLEATDVESILDSFQPLDTPGPGRGDERLWRDALQRLTAL